MARTLFERKLDGRRTSSKLAELVELVMAKPLVSAAMVAKSLDVTPAGGAADRFGTGPQGNDREGEVAGVGHHFERTTQVDAKPLTSPSITRTGEPPTRTRSNQRKSVFRAFGNSIIPACRKAGNQYIPRIVGARELWFSGGANLSQEDHDTVRDGIEGESKSLNFKVSDDFKKEFKGFAVAHGITMTDLLKEGFELVKMRRKGA